MQKRKRKIEDSMKDTAHRQGRVSAPQEQSNKKGIFSVKKRMISGVLAAVMLLSTAYAAEGSTPDGTAAADTAVSADAAEQTVKLVFKADTPLTGANGDMVTEILKNRLAALGYKDYTVTVSEDGTGITAAFPHSTQVSGLADYLVQPAAFTASDADGKVWLTNEDLKQVTSSKGSKDSTGCIVMTLTTKGRQSLREATTDIASRDSDRKLYIKVDGKTIASPTISGKIDSSSVNIENNFTEQVAENYALLLNAGALPVTLTVSSAPAANDKPIDGDDNNGGTTTEPTSPTTPTNPDTPDTSDTTEFPDMKGHWAEAALKKGITLGLLKGSNGKMLPNDPVRGSEALTILNRALGASEQDSTASLAASQQNQWYTSELGKAIHLNLIDAADSRNFANAATRAEAFVYIVRAFVYDRAESGTDELSVFTDTGSMTTAQKQAAAALVASGVIKGDTATTLAPDKKLTRAEFVTMITRITGNISAEYTDAAGGSIVSGDTTLTASNLTGDLIFSVPVHTVNLSDVSTPNRVVLKGCDNVTLTADGQAGMSVLAADPADSANITLGDSVSVNTLVIAGDGGAVTFSGKAANIEITASNRVIDLSGMTADTLTITGSGNTVNLGGTVGAAAIESGAKNTRLSVDGSAGSLLVAGYGSTVGGAGHADSMEIRAAGCNVTLACDNKVENIDTGIKNVKIDIGVPTKVTAGGSLVSQATFSGVEGTKICKAQWYQDGKPLSGLGNDNFELTDGKVSKHTTYFTFTKNMKTSVTTGFKLTYVNPSTGETEEVYAEKTVPIENYSNEWYQQRDVDRVLKLVSSTYRGNYTTSYAVNNDYKSYEKETWVNAKGYSSKSSYLVWINRAYQHVNVFTGSKGNWKLVKSFVVGTGAADTPTPTGLTTVTYKLKAGWTTSTYTVRPVIGFYPDTGYAFHSRLCTPNTDKEYDFSSGYPVSHGCVRMQKNDVNWIYDNVPIGSTVVIF